MSQTETLLLVILGFSLATLIALFVGRFLWVAALKLGARRMQKQVPSSLVGLQTERDRLRAEFAMLSQRLGSRLEATNIRMAESMAEVSRHRNRLEAAKAELKSRDEKIASLQENLAVLAAQLADAAAVESELRKSISEYAAASQTNFAQSTPARYPAPAELPPPDESELRFQPVSEDRLRQRIGKLNELAHTAAQDREAAGRSSTIPLPASSDSLSNTRFAEAERHNDDLNTELEKLDAEWAKRLEDLNVTQPEESGVEETRQEEKPSGPLAVANVISLANRIRDLKKGLGNT